MRDLTRRESWLPISSRKVIPPFTLDPTLTFYCPQENLEAFDHPLVSAFQRAMQEEYQPPQAAGTMVALLLPCTKTKPYPLSPEHLAVNSFLLRRGFRPNGPADFPAALVDAVPDGLPAEVLHNGLLERDGLLVHRLVVSEPMGLVPYEHVYNWRGEPSPAARYDDPGLFEHRGFAVGLWRADNSAVRLPGGKYRWGPLEQAAYAAVHNRLSAIMAATLERLSDNYERIIAYVSLGLTHRSFLTSRDEKSAIGLLRSKRTTSGYAALLGVNDQAPGLVRVVPGPDELKRIEARLAERLREEQGLSAAESHAYFTAGGSEVIPLIVPESLAILEQALLE